MGGRNRLDFSASVGTDLVLCEDRILPGLVSGSNLTWFCVGGHRNWLVSRVGIEADLASVMGSKLTWLLCGGSKLTRFCVWVENDWFSVWGSIDLVFAWVVEIDFLFFMRAENYLLLVWASKLTWFLYGRSKLTWVLYSWSKLTWFQCRDRNWLVSFVAVENDLILVPRSKLTRFFVSGHRNRLDIRMGIEMELISVVSLNKLDFGVRDRNLLHFNVGIEIDLSFVWGSNLTSLLCAGRKLLCFNVWIKIGSVFVCGPKMTCF